MAAGVQFVWTPDPEVYATSMLAVAGALEDRTVPLAAAGEAMRGSIKESFDTESSPEGEPWPRWSASYADRQNKINMWQHSTEVPSKKILEKTGELKRAATSTEAIKITNDATFYQTPALPHYGLAHNEGVPGRKSPLPQRQFIGLSDEARGVILGEFFSWFDGAISLYPTSRGNIGRRHAFRAIPGGFFLPMSSFE